MISLATVPTLLSQIRAAVRFDAWYASKVPFVWTACLFAAAASPLSDAAVEGRTAAVIVFTCCCAAFGHVANDYADRDCDRLKGRISRAAGLTGRGAWLVMAALAGLSLAFLAMAATIPAAVAGVATPALAAAYSLPPLRLKGRGAAGVWSAAAAQRTLPVLVAFAALAPLNADAWAFAAVAQLAGIRWMLVHEIIDAPADRRAGIATHVARVGEARARALLRRVVLPLELAAIVAALWSTALSRPAVWAIGAAGILASGLGALLYRRRMQPAYSLEGFSRQPLAGFYYAIWPLGAAALLMVSRPGLWPLAIACVLWTVPYIRFQLATAVRLMRRQEAARAAAAGNGAVTDLE